MSLRSSKATPDRVIELIRTEVSRTSIYALSKATRINTNSIRKYLRGDGEPTIATLQCLANYFGEIFVIEIKPEGQEVRP